MVTVLLARFNVAVLGGRRCDMAGMGAGGVTWQMWGPALCPGAVAWLVTVGWLGVGRMEATVGWWGVARGDVTDRHADVSSSFGAVGTDDLK